jgi:SRSO17 transposase
MDAQQVRGLGPRLRRFLTRFDDCFHRSDTRSHLATYCRGLLSNLPRKSVEPIALEAGLPPRTLQQFLSLLDWDHDRLRDQAQRLVAQEHATLNSVGILDDTGCIKKGTKTPGVQRQYSGAAGKVDNCVITVHLAYAADDLHCLLDSDLYLPQSWDQDRLRCREAGIPDTVVYRPKWQIGLELLERAQANGVRFSWLTMDEGYGGVPELLRRLHRSGQRFVAEVPTTFTGWLRVPRPGPGRTLTPTRPACGVAALARYQPVLRDQPWVAYRVKDGQKGPMVWEVKEARFYAKTEEGDPAWPWRLVIARNALDRSEVKYFVSNAKAEVSVTQILLAAFSRWREERCFEDEKTELGFDHYEGRSYRGMLRHQRLTALMHLFCGRERIRLRGEKSGVDGLPGADGSECVGGVVVAEWESDESECGAGGGEDRTSGAEECSGPAQPHEADAASIAGSRLSTNIHATLPMERQLAL